MENPTSFQIIMAVRAGRARFGLERKAWGGIFAMDRRLLIRPSWEWYIMDHSTDTTITDVTTGVKTALRTKAVPRFSRARNRARIRENRTWSGTL